MIGCLLQVQKGIRYDWKTGLRRENWWIYIIFFFLDSVFVSKLTNAFSYFFFVHRNPIAVG